MSEPKYLINSRVKLRTYQILQSKSAIVKEVTYDNIFNEHIYMVSYDVGGEGCWSESSLGDEFEPDYPNIPFITTDEGVTQEEPPLTESETITQPEPQQESQMTESVTQEESSQITMLVEETFNPELEEVTIELPTLTKQNTFRLNPLNY